MKSTLSYLLLVACFLASCGNRKEAFVGQKDDTTIADSSDTNVLDDQSGPPTQKIIEKLPGSWMADSPVEQKKNASSGFSLPADRIEFTVETKYRAWQGNALIDSGRYRVNEPNAVLYLESIGKDSIAEWNISFYNDKLTLLERNEKPGRQKFVFTRGQGH